MGKNSLAVAMAFAGAVIGAGFATGREVVDFFTRFGRGGLGGVLLATLLFTWVGVVILQVTLSHPVYSYADLLRVLLPWKWLVFLMDQVFMVTLLAGVGVMTAAGATVLGGWGPGYPLGCLGFLALSALLLRTGGKGFLRANCWLVPGMALLIAALCLVQIAVPALGMAARGPFSSALLYVSFNTAIAGVALSTLKEQLDRKTALLGGGLGGLMVGLLLLLIYGATRGLAAGEIPLLSLAQVWLGKWQWLYALVLLAAVLTTALANIHGLASRMADGLGYWPTVFGTSVLGFAIAQGGFARLVRVLYPLLGLGNVVLLAGLCYYSFRNLKITGGNRWF